MSIALVIKKGVTVIGKTVFLPYMLHEERVCRRVRLSPLFNPISAPSLRRSMGGSLV